MPEAQIVETSSKLTLKQLMFCKHYAVHFNGTQAAIDANYSKRGAAVQASKLLRKAKIQKQIQKEVKAAAKRIDISQEKVLQAMAQLAFSDAEDYFEIDEGGGLRLKTFEELPEGASKAIKTIEENRIIKETKDGDVLVFDKMKYVLHDKIRPLISLGNYLGIKFERLNINGKLGVLHEAGIGMKELMDAYNKVNNGNRIEPGNRNKSK